MYINIEVDDSGICKIESHAPDSKIVKYVTMTELFNLFRESTASYVSPVMPVSILKFASHGTVQKYLSYRATPDGMFKFTVDSREYSLHFPYIYWLTKIDTVGNTSRVVGNQFFVSYNSPGVETDMYVPLLNNVYIDGSMCYGSNSRIITQSFPSDDLYTLLNVQNTWLNSDHNLDYVRGNAWSRIQAQNGVRFANYAAWMQSGLFSRNTNVNTLIS